MGGSFILYSTDLMLLSSAGHAARQSGLDFHSVTSIEAAGPHLQNPETLFCLDLSMLGADPQSIAALAAPEVLSRAIAFGPHVHTARLDAARAAGFGKVLTRGQFFSRIQSGQLLE
ncbi:MAG: hypothetical protein ACKOEO_03495 [Planctomycetaceae bacterium]